MNAKYCVAFNVGGRQWHERHTSLTDVMRTLRQAHESMGFTTVIREGEVVQADVADIYPVCDDCNDRETYHDYPDRRYQIGQREGVQGVYV